MQDSKSLYKVVLVSLVCTLFVSFPNVLFMHWDWPNIPNKDGQAGYINGMLIRFGLFWLISLLQLICNHLFLKKQGLAGRMVPNLIFTAVAFLIYKGVTSLICKELDGRPIILTFQFMVIGMTALLLGYTDYLSRIHKKKEEELQQLKIESLQSRCTALTNQINPHFFFNSLNGISSLVRKKDEKTTICYIDHLSDIFRYILQSEHKGLVTVAEELDFARSFCEVMEVRYAGKLAVSINVPEEKMNRELPVLALLPLMENVTVHNMIDSEHIMKIDITMNDENELMVTNPIYEKEFRQETHGTGLQNLGKRFMLLMDKQIRTMKEEGQFKVFLPTKS